MSFAIHPCDPAPHGYGGTNGYGGWRGVHLRKECARLLPDLRGQRRLDTLLQPTGQIQQFAVQQAAAHPGRKITTQRIDQLIGAKLALEVADASAYQRGAHVSAVIQQIRFGKADALGVQHAVPEERAVIDADKIIEADVVRHQQPAAHKTAPWRHIHLGKPWPCLPIGQRGAEKKGRQAQETIMDRAAVLPGLLVVVDTAAANNVGIGGLTA